MNIASLFGVLFFAGAIYNLFTGDYPNAAVGGSVGLALILIDGGLQALGDLNRGGFAQWLSENRHAVQNGGATYRGVEIHPHTIVRSFDVAVSVLLVSWRAHSRPYVPGAEFVWLRGTILTMLSLALGWWAFPWGPVHTIQAVGTNLGGGRRLLVAEVLRSLDAAAANARTVTAPVAMAGA
ncbi:MAG: hypothetical protein CMJ83_03230 [Planctomycetes bacterium]|nr:hypothetical protein [Planctomycetota bacterium]